MGSGETDAAPPMATDPNGTGTVLDDIRNPMCTVAPQMPDCYTQNRATLHLHGGTTPWISDGTPHQWITPADETTRYPQGVAVQNVPDMVGASAPAGVPDCTAATDGCQTFYYTNQQSARLMFYHDHAWGITRLNVYAGEAAGYVLTDATEQKLIGTGGLSPASASAPRSSSRTAPSSRPPRSLPVRTRRGTPPSGAASATCGTTTSTCRPRTRPTRRA